MTNRLPSRTRRLLSSRRHRSRGQALVEFSLVLPIFIFIMLTIIEFAFVFNAMLGISFASRDGALAAAEGGGNAHSDCAILEAVDAAVGPPMNQNRISSVVIYRTNAAGSYTAYPATRNTFTPGGSMTCHPPVGVDYTIPWTQTTSGYPTTARCNVLSGCGGDHLSVDYIGVHITYVHTWVTPLRGIGGPSGLSVTVVQSTSMRMEPVL